MLTSPIRLALAVSYRESDFAAVGSPPPGFGSESDELIFSDHYDENPATAVEAVADVKMWLDLRGSAPKLPRDGRHFLCRHMWLTKEKRLVDLAVAAVLDGDQVQRSISLLRGLIKKSYGNKAPANYKDPAGPNDFDRPSKSPSKSKRASSGSAATGGSAKKKLSKRSRDDGSGGADDKDDNDDDAGAANNGADDGDVEAGKAEKQKAKKANVKRLPTFEEAEQLLLTRGELALLSTTKSFGDIVGGLVLLKHKDAAGQPQTTLLEIEKLPDVEAPYRPYPISYIAVDGHTETLPDCVAGIELLMEGSEPSRRSLVNVRDRAIDKVDYDAWARKSLAGSRYPTSGSEIKSTIARLDALRKQFTTDKVKAPEPVAQ